MPEVNEYELAGRREKAKTLTSAFVSGGFTTEYVRQMTEEDWTNLSQDLQLKKKPSEPTRAMVIEQLEQLELLGRIARGEA